MEPELGDPDAPAVTRPMLVVRPRKEPIPADYVHQVAFRRAYPDRECELVYTHMR